MQFEGVCDFGVEEAVLKALEQIPVVDLSDEADLAEPPRGAEEEFVEGESQSSGSGSSSEGVGPIVDGLQVQAREESESTTAEEEEEEEEKKSRKLWDRVLGGDTRRGAHLASLGIPP